MTKSSATRAPTQASDTRARHRTVVFAIVLGLAALAGGMPSTIWSSGAFKPVTDVSSILPNNASSISPNDGGPSNHVLPKLLVMAPTPKTRGEAIALGAVVHDLGAGGLAVVRGLPAGATLSAGRKMGDSDWWLSAADISATTIEPPPNFVGAMNVAIELRLPDTSLVDRQTLHFTWQDAIVSRAKPIAQAPPSPAYRLSPEEVAASLKRGQDLQASGDLAAARLVFQHLAEVGNADAARALAKIYDPVAQEKAQAYGFASDPELAKYWYEKARDYESSGAQRQLQLADH
jgi:hypothetical protein